MGYEGGGYLVPSEMGLGMSVKQKNWGTGPSDVDMYADIVRYWDIVFNKTFEAHILLLSDGGAWWLPSKIAHAL